MLLKVSMSRDLTDAGQMAYNKRLVHDMFSIGWGRVCAIILQLNCILHGPSMFAVKAKIIECFIIKPAQSLLKKHLVIGQR